MIKFALRCACDSEFESWFPDGAAYEKQARAGLIACPRCGSTKIKKAPMAPALVGVARGRDASGEVETVQAAENAPRGRHLREKLLAMRREIDANTVDVGKNFAQEARDMHDGVKPEAAIRGQATPQEAKALLEDGIPVFPVPPSPDEMN